MKSRSSTFKKVIKILLTVVICIVCVRRAAMGHFTLFFPVCHSRYLDQEKKAISHYVRLLVFGSSCLLRCAMGHCGV